MSVCITFPSLHRVRARVGWMNEWVSGWVEGGRKAWKDGMSYTRQQRNFLE